MHDVVSGGLNLFGMLHRVDIAMLLRVGACTDKLRFMGAFFDCVWMYVHIFGCVSRETNLTSD